MEQENDQVKQQSEKQLQEIQKRHLLEQKRAAFYAQREKELKEAQEAREKATNDKKLQQEKLKQQIMLTKQLLRGRR